MRKIKEKNKNSKIFNILGFAIIVFHLLLIFLPCLWGIAQTFKTRINWMEDRVGFPTEMGFHNYELFFEYFYVDIIRDGIPDKVFFEKAVLYTVLYAGGVAVTSFVVQFITAYSLYKHRHFKASKFIYAMLIIMMNLPLAGSGASELALYHQLGLYDNLYAMWFLKAHPLGFFLLVFYATFSSIPNATYEAAEIDGASRLQIMIKIALPLIKGTVLLFLLTSFIGSWNNYVDVLYVMPNYPTVGYALYKFNLTNNPPEIAHPTVKLTGAFICAVPMILILIFFGDKLMQNVSISGGVKG